MRGAAAVRADCRMDKDSVFLRSRDVAFAESGCCGGCGVHFPVARGALLRCAGALSGPWRGGGRAMRGRHSPMTVATMLRPAARLRNSQRQMPCQVPSPSRPSTIGIVISHPVSVALAWRHVVGSFERVGIVGTPLGDEAVEYPFEVRADVGVGILGEGEPGGGVAQEEVQHARAGQRWQVGDDFVGYEVKPPAAGTQGEYVLSDHGFGAVSAGAFGASGMQRYEILRFARPVLPGSLRIGHFLRRNGGLARLQGRPKSRIFVLRKEKVIRHEEDHQSVARAGGLPLFRLRPEQPAGPSHGVLRAAGGRVRSFRAGSTRCTAGFRRRWPTRSAAGSSSASSRRAA